MSDTERDELAELVGDTFHNEFHDPSGHAADAILAAGYRKPKQVIQYAGNVRNGAWNSAPGGWDEKDWHQSATGDTGTSHTLPGRLYIVQCEWCPQAFAANTKAEAMVMFRKHEDEMLGHQR